MHLVESQGEHDSPATAYHPTARGKARTGRLVTTHGEASGPQQGTGTARTCAVASPPLEYPTKLEGKGAVGEDNGERHEPRRRPGARDGDCTGQHRDSSEVGRPLSDDGTNAVDAAQSASTPMGPADGTCGTRTVAPAIPRHSTSNRRTDIPGSDERALWHPDSRLQTTAMATRDVRPGKSVYRTWGIAEGLGRHARIARGRR